jgi:hypothetical protein
MILITTNFEYPDLYEFVEKERIKVDKMEDYENMDDIPLVYFLVTFKENYFITVGTQIVLLNENVMLVGVWEILFWHIGCENIGCENIVILPLLVQRF